MNITSKATIFLAFTSAVFATICAALDGRMTTICLTISIWALTICVMFAHFTIAEINRRT
jgi:hypothetical protein